MLTQLMVIFQVSVPNPLPIVYTRRPPPKSGAPLPPKKRRLSGDLPYQSAGSEVGPCPDDCPPENVSGITG